MHLAFLFSVKIRELWLTVNVVHSCFGSILGFMATATHGASIVFPTEAFDPHATLSAVREHACTALYGVPTMFVAELDLLASGAFPYTTDSDPSTSTSTSNPNSHSSPQHDIMGRGIPEGFEQLRTGIAAGSSIPAELMRKLHGVLNLTEMTICYGMTETSPVSAMTTPTDPLQKRLDTVGKLLPHVEAKVVDPADWKRTLGVGERGELAVSGYLVMKGYWDDALRTAEVLVVEADGDVCEDGPNGNGNGKEKEKAKGKGKGKGKGKTWMMTGDEASIDAEGYIQITGRIKDLIIRGGENIHPLEIENCLFAHPSISEVSVVGLPDERLGEVVAAFVVRSTEAKGKESGLLTREEVREWVRQRLSPHLVPKYVFWLDSYPKTASGKIQKFRLREMGTGMVEAGEGV